jgi:chromosome segregation ATPase
MGFEPSRKTQRFCSTRCADRQRDRRRRKRNQGDGVRTNDTYPAQSPTATEAECHSQSVLKPRVTSRGQDAAIKQFQQTIDALQTQLRSQSLDLDRVEADNAEQQARVSVLQAELAGLKRAQRTNVQDLAHVAARLVAITQAKQVPLDTKTIEILRRRGWIAPKRRAEVRGR